MIIGVGRAVTATIVGIAVPRVPIIPPIVAPIGPIVWLIITG